MATSASGATYVKTTSGSIITVVPKSLATLGGKIISSNIVSGEFDSSVVLLGFRWGGEFTSDVYIYQLTTGIFYTLKDFK